MHIIWVLTEGFFATVGLFMVGLFTAGSVIQRRRKRKP